MLGFSRWRQWLDEAFPRGDDFAELLAEEARLVARSTAVFQEQLGSGTIDLGATDAAYLAVQEKAGTNLHALHRAFATEFDREDIFRGIDELSWVADHVDHAAREFAVLDLVPDEAMRSLAATLVAGCEQLADAFEQLGSDRTAALLTAQGAAETDDLVRRRYEEALRTLFVPGTDPLDAMKRREIYHHMSDSGKRVRKAARVVMAMVVKDPS